MWPIVVASMLLGALACGDSKDENTGESCEVADDCYPDIDHQDLAGEVECLDRVPDGYCTHLCLADGDCCSVEGECESGVPQVCAPFESSTETRCFLSCEPDVLGGEEENEYCQEHTHRDFLCRSTGGGSSNRKVCVPQD